MMPTYELPLHLKNWAKKIGREEIDRNSPKIPNWRNKLLLLALALAVFVVLWLRIVRAEENYKLSQHFCSQELACRHCSQCKVNMELIIALEKLRNKVNCPIIITSGYRCPFHNKAVGGASHSQHLYGNAVDVKIKGYTPTQVARLAKECGFTWTKTYLRWTHIDIRQIQLARQK